MYDFRRSVSGSASSALVILLSSTALSPAYADCQTSGTQTLNCSGDVAPIAYDRDIINVNVGSLTSDMTDTGGAAAYISIQGTAAGQKDDADSGFRAQDSDTGDTHTYGKAATGYSSFFLSTTLDLDNGHSLLSNSGAVLLHSTAAEGADGKESKGGGSTHRGEFGGDGGAGGRLTFQASGTQQGNAGAVVSGQTNPTLDFKSTGGEGGDGGEGYHTLTFHRGYGGGGGQGGKGGAISAEFKGDASLTANADGHDGVSVVTIGGDGGDGGEGKSGDKGIGGVGGIGGDGGDVTLTATSAENSISATNGIGVYVNSVAGRGGDGGRASGTDVAAGDGGDGGQGGDVTVDLAGSVTTTGADSHGLFIQTRGGATGTVGSTGGSGIQKHKGKSGDSGRGGVASVTLSSLNVETAGLGAQGVLVQSVGGFGASDGDARSSASYGADGGSGGDGGAVNLTLGSSNPNSVKTTGDKSTGVSALSVGGGGGSGASSSGISALGGEGQAGGSGDTVTASISDTSVKTEGTGSIGILAASIGGGGGAGGGASGVVAHGGSGGDGGDGGAVDVSFKGTNVSTQKDGGLGVVAASIGGGGGVSHNSSGFISHGASGGDGGDGGKVSYTSQGQGLNVNTSGDHADGISALSVGGGGGQGGGNVDVSIFATHKLGGTGGNGGAGGDIALNGAATDKVNTSGNNSAGLAAVTVGGGGGRSGSSTAVSLVGAAPGNSDTPGVSTELGTSDGGGGSGNHGGDISGTFDAAITTQGASSAGVLLVSAGQGGGAAGNYTSVEVGARFSNTLGASGGDGGDGGDIDVTLGGDITTKGDHSGGIDAVSVGGGGGHSSNLVNATVGVAINTSNSQGAAGGAGGDGGDITLTSNGAIQTQGAHSAGISAVSVANGGGKSGHSVNAGVDAVDLDSSVKAGFGGDGGTSGHVDVTNNGQIQTSGGLSHGVLAVSVAGGGGASGTSVDGTIAVANLQVDQGNYGGSGGTGGDVNVTTGKGSGIATAGDKASGVMALSLGGAGGAGGSVYSGSLSALNFSGVIGGYGGAGGTAGTVVINNGGSISTSGNDASGIVAMSIGGHGGTGGVATDGSASAAVDVPNVNISVSIGGDGGEGGIGGPVTLTNDGKIDTAGYRSAGILAQSIGGSGGSGGAIYSGNLNVVFDGELNVAVGVGGTGGDGGVAGKVDITNTGTINTTGGLASAIYAQSVGGNGGVAANSYLGTANLGSPAGLSSTTSVGGSGGSGALGGDVTVANKAALTTTGKSAHGIYAQSIGGNGGDGGAGVGYLADFGASSSDYVSLNQTTFIGGSGGSGMDAGAVDVTNDAAITTSANSSYGISAQSVGGGGGDGGDAGSYALGYLKTSEDVENKGFSLDVTVGGKGGASGDGDKVSVSNTKAITTAGSASYAIFAQSIGGGGGKGGNAELDFEGILAVIYDYKEKAASLKEFVEELKKIHGKEWKSLLLEGWSVDIGGAGGASGDGGDVTVNNTDTLTTTGNSATAIYAQSVGGGGGVGGDGSEGLLTTVSVARNGSGGGDGGDIKITSAGDIHTSGDGAMGIQVQSLGGGGGNAGEVEGGIIQQIGDFAETLGAQVFGPIDGEKGGDGGNGGAITIEMAGTLTTSGENAHGIWAHSVGGGGGAAPEIGGEGEDSTKAAIGSAGAKGDSGLVSVSVPGTVSVSGEGAHAIFAQSVAGTDSNNGGVQVTVAGTVEASGKNGRAILVQADQVQTASPKKGVSTITVEQGGTVRKTGSEDNFGAIGFLTGASSFNSDGSIAQSNALINHGTIFSDATVVESDGKGALRLNNFGTIYGQLHFAGDAQTEVTVEKGGTFNLGDSNLGTDSNSVFTNSGTVKPGWENDTRQFTVKSGGSFVQTQDGTLKIDVDLSSGSVENGQLVLETGSASLDGLIAPNFVHNPDLKNGDTGTLQDVVSYTGGGTLTNTGLSAPTQTAVAYTLNWDANDSLSIDYEVDYTGRKSGAGLSQNAVRFGQFFADTLKQLPAAEMRDSRSQALSDLGQHILNAGSGQELAAIYSEHIVDEAIIGSQIALSSAQGIHNFLNSCPSLDASNPETFYRQQECFWGQAIGQTANQDATDSLPEFDGHSSGFAIGAQKEIGAGWFIEGGAQYMQTSISGDNFSMDGSQVNAGIALKKEIGKFEFSGSIAGGTFDNDHDRDYSVLTDRFNASGDIDGYFASAELRAAAIYEMDGTYFKPSAALLVSHISQDGFSETGNGNLNWVVDDVDHTAVYIRPMLELGRAFEWSNGYGVGFVRTGITHQLTDPGMDLRTQLAGGDGDLTLTVSPDRTQFDVAVGVNAELGDGFALELIGNSSFSDSRDVLSGQIRLQWQF